TLGARAEADVAPQPERLRLRARVTNEERAGDGGDGRAEGELVAMTREDQRDRAEHRTLPDAVGRRVEERSKRRRLAAGPGECAVEDVEDRADDEHGGAEPVEEQVVAILEVDEDGRGEAERDAGRRQRVGRDPGAGEADDR